MATSNETASIFIADTAATGWWRGAVLYLTNPSSFFGELVSRPRWLAMYGGTVSLLGAATFLTGPLAGRVALEMAAVNMPPDRIAAAAHMLTMTRILELCLVPLAELAHIFFVTAVCWFVVTVAASLMLSFRATLCIVCYAWLPNAIDRLYGAASNYLGNYANSIAAPGDIHTLSPSLGDFVSTSVPFVNAVDHQITGFYLWSIFLLVVGLSRLAGRHNRASLLTAVVLSQVILVLVLAAVRTLMQAPHI